MKVKLVSYSQPTEDFTKQGIDDAQELIAFCARVSNPSNQFNTETSDKLINYLIKHQHWSPLEMVSACLEIETTRDIARQILRHRSFSFQEFSQRYADPTKDLDFVVREARLQDLKNRQNSVEVGDSDNENILKDAWRKKQEFVIAAAKNFLSLYSSFINFLKYFFFTSAGYILQEILCFLNAAFHNNGDLAPFEGLSPIINAYFFIEFSECFLRSGFLLY